MDAEPTVLSLSTKISEKCFRYLVVSVRINTAQDKVEPTTEMAKCI